MYFELAGEIWGEYFAGKISLTERDERLDRLRVKFAAYLKSYKR